MYQRLLLSGLFMAWLLLGPVPYLYSQVADTVAAHAALVQARAWQDQQLPDSADRAYQAAMQGYLAAGAMEAYLQAGFDRAVLSERKGAYLQAVEQLQPLAARADSALPSPHPLRGHFHNQLGANYFKLNRFQDALVAFSRGREERIARYGPQHRQVAGSTVNIGLAYQYLNFREEAIVYFQEAIALLTQLGDSSHIFLANAYNNMGSCLEQLGEYRSALTYQQKAMEIHQANQNLPGIASAYHNLAVLSEVMLENEQALTYYHKALDLKESVLGPDHPILISTLMNMGLTYRITGDYPQALSALQRSLRLSQENFGPQALAVSACMGNLSDVYYAQEDFEQARDRAWQARNAFPVEQIENRPDLARVYQRLAAAYQGLEQYDSALVAIDSAQRYAIQEKVLGRQLPPTLLLKVLGWKARIFRSRFAQSQDLQDLQSSLQEYRQLIALVDTIRIGFNDPEAKAFLVGETRPIFEQAIECAHLLYQQEKDEALMEVIFELIQKSKSLILLETLKSSRYRKFAGIPDEVIHQERDLKTRLDFFQIQYLQAQRSEDDQVSYWQQQTLQTQIALETLLRKLKKKYPDYYRLKYDTEVPSLDEAQSFLRQQGKSQLIEYFWGDQHLYIFSLNSQETKLHRIPEADKLKADLDKFLTLLPQDLEADKADEMSELSLSLYQQLLSPVLQEQAMPASLLIIPDGRLGYLPFEVLSSSNSQGNPPHYLISDFSIQYAAGLSLLLHTSLQHSDYTETFLGFAPAYDADQYFSQNREARVIFPEDSQAFAPLLNNQEEVSRIASNLKGKAILGDEASEIRFRELAANSPILHLAMHAFVNDSLPLYSGLVFSTQGSARPADDQRAGSSPQNSATHLAEAEMDGFLHTYEIYGLSLPARLAVLSACNTGRGKYVRGEGINSLARAFQYAGCPSVLMSLWQVDDAATADLMIRFYQHLQAGLPKSESLRQAKLDYVLAHPDASPRLWAAFVLIGEDEALFEPGKMQRRLALGFMALLALGAIFYLVGKARRAEKRGRS